MLTNESGVSTVEYTLCLAILLIVFMVGGLAVRDSGVNRAEESMNKAKTSIPCSANLDQSAGQCA